MQPLWSGVRILALTMLCGMTSSAGRAISQELIEGGDHVVKYELSNLRVGKGITGDQISFDYKRVREGKGTPRLSARTDRGPINISGFDPRIESQGTIRLEDQFARTREVLNRGGGDFGVEFFFTVEADLGSPINRYLVSNSVIHGTLRTGVQARPLSANELMEQELQRKAKVPPTTVPPGYTRVDASTKLLPGVPVLIGSVGEWVPGKVVSLPYKASVKYWRDGQHHLGLVSRDGWLAIADETLREIDRDPSQFSIDLRTLPDGFMLLTDDEKPLLEVTPSGLPSLPRGTPLLLENFSRWDDVYLISSDNATVRVVRANESNPVEQSVPVKQLAIRQATLDALSSDEAMARFAANVANVESMTPSSTPAKVAASATAASQTVPMTSTVPFPTSIDSAEEPSPRTPVTRVWKDFSGKFSVSATLESKSDVDAVLKKSDGTIIKVPIAKLSDADKAFLETGEGSLSTIPFDSVVSSASSTSGPLDYQVPLKGVFNVGDLRARVLSVAISPDNRFLLVGRATESALMYDLKSGRVLIDSGRMGHMGEISVCAFTPDNKHLLLGGGRGIVEVYAMAEKGKLKPMHQFGAHAKQISCISFSRDGRYALTGGHDKQARYWEVETGREVGVLKDFDGPIKATCIAPSGKTLMATDGKTLQIAEVGSEANARKIQVARSHVSGQAAAFSPNGLLLAVGDTYDFHLWNLQVESEMPLLKGTEIGWRAVFSPDNQHLITGGKGTINVWDARTQSLVQSFQVTTSFNIQAINVNADGSLITSPAGHGIVGVFQASR